MKIKVFEFKWNKIKSFLFVFGFIENWNGTCDRLIELIEANELAQMNTIDLQTYSKLILELDSIITSYKQTIAK